MERSTVTPIGRFIRVVWMNCHNFTMCWSVTWVVEPVLNGWRNTASIRQPKNADSASNQALQNLGKWADAGESLVTSRSGQTGRCVHGWLDDLERHSDPAQDVWMYRKRSEVETAYFVLFHVRQKWHNQFISRWFQRYSVKYGGFETFCWEVDRNPNIKYPVLCSLYVENSKIRNYWYTLSIMEQLLQYWRP